MVQQLETQMTTKRQFCCKLLNEYDKCKWSALKTLLKHMNCLVFQDQTAQDPSAIDMFITGLFLQDSDL